jgi:hypothetical protein
MTVCSGSASLGRSAAQPRMSTINRAGRFENLSGSSVCATGVARPPRRERSYSATSLGVSVPPAPLALGVARVRFHGESIRSKSFRDSHCDRHCRVGRSRRRRLPSTNSSENPVGFWHIEVNPHLRETPNAIDCRPQGLC